MIKNLFLDKTINFLSSYHKYSDEELEKLQYGLEGIYLTFTKLIVIVLLAIILKIFKEVIIILLLFNVIRYFGFGIHAKKSSECLISSTLCFILLPYIFLHINFTKEILFIIGIISLIHIIILAPADTIKRPFKNKKKKLIRKILTTIVALIYLILAIILNIYFSKLFILSILIETIMIHPITYKIMRQSYNNYKSL